MKTFLILVLILALCAAAFFTRPSQANFKQYIIDQNANATAGDGSVVGQIKAQAASMWDRAQAEQFADSCIYKDRFLWVDVQKDGQTLYTGAFNHWFNHSNIKADLNKAKDKVNSTAHQIDSVTLQKQQ